MEYKAKIVKVILSGSGILGSREKKPPRLYSAFASSSMPLLEKGGECVAYLTV